MYFNVIDGRGVAESKVQPRVACGGITAAGDNIAALAHFVGGKINGRADSVPRTLRSADQLELDPMVLVGRDVAQQRRNAIQNIDDHIDLAVVEEVINVLDGVPALLRN